MNASDHLVLETVTGPKLLGEVHGTLDRAWAQHRHVPRSIQIGIATAVAEVGANIVQYADVGIPVPLRMDVDVGPHRVTVIFIDGGKPAVVDLDTVKFPAASAKQGRGLALASAVLAKLSYKRHDALNQWTLVSRRFD